VLRGGNHPSNAGGGKTLPDASPAEGYRIRTTSAASRTTHWVIGADAAGVMYGGLELALFRATNKPAHQDAAVRELTEAAGFWRQYGPFQKFCNCYGHRYQPDAQARSG
jgi:hypothetical protein